MDLTAVATATATTSTPTTLLSATAMNFGNGKDLNFTADFTKHIPAAVANGIFLNATYPFLPPFWNPNMNLTLVHKWLNANEPLYAACPPIQNPIGSLVAMILYAVVCIVGLLGNTLVIYVVLRFSKMQTVTNMYILNLAIADECFLIGIPFLITTMQVGEWTFGKAMCKAYMVSTSITQFTSSIFLFIMSADRYIAVCHPISSPRYRSPFVSRIVTAVAWTTSALLMLPVMMYATTIEKDNKMITCNIEWPADHEHGSGTTFILYSLILGFAIPLSLILSFYYLVIRKLRTVGPKTKSKEKKRSHRKVTKLVLTVITVYVLCWLPYWISQVMLIMSPPEHCQTRIEITIILLAGCLGYSNSALNPILYAFLSDNFKKSFLKACTCAAGKDFNAQLQLENSFFPRLGKRNSEKLCTLKSIAGQNNPSNSNLKSLVGDGPIILTTPICESAISIETCNKATVAPVSNQFIVTTSTSNLAIEVPTSDILVSDCIVPERPPVLHTDL